MTPLPHTLTAAVVIVIILTAAGGGVLDVLASLVHETLTHTSRSAFQSTRPALALVLSALPLAPLFADCQCMKLSISSIFSDYLQRRLHPFVK